MAVQKRGGPHHDAGADEIHQRLESVRSHQETGQRDEGGNAVARQHPVVDLEHVDRPGQHQNIHRAGEHGDAQESAPALPQRRRNGRMRGRPGSHRRGTRRSVHDRRGSEPSVRPNLRRPMCNNRVRTAANFIVPPQQGCYRTQVSAGAPPDRGMQRPVRPGRTETNARRHGPCAARPGNPGRGRPTPCGRRGGGALFPLPRRRATVAPHGVARQPNRG